MPSKVDHALINFADLATTLEQQVARFVNDFNDHNWDDLRNNVLDRNVLVVGIDQPQAHTYSGIEPVIQFLTESKGHFDQKASFFEVLGDNGHAIGVGLWTDKDDTNSPILFSFVFLNRGTSAAPEWKAIRLWGSRPLGDLRQ